MGKAIDISNMEFGMLKVINKTDKRDSDGNIIWNCKCECGNITEATYHNLKRGHKKSCGCLSKEILNKYRSSNFKHGCSNTRLYSCWCGMKKRCYNKNTSTYKNYGGRGIIVCDEWKEDFISFYNWAINNGYSNDLTIDRIDVNGNYEPSNCRWTDIKTQCNNRRSNTFYTYKGITHTIAEWVEITKIPTTTLVNRIKNGYSEDEIFSKSRGR